MGKTPPHREKKGGRREKIPPEGEEKGARGRWGPREGPVPRTLPGGAQGPRPRGLKAAVPGGEGKIPPEGGKSPPEGAWEGFFFFIRGTLLGSPRIGTRGWARGPGRGSSRRPVGGAAPGMTQSVDRSGGGPVRGRGGIVTSFPHLNFVDVTVRVSR